VVSTQLNIVIPTLGRSRALNATLSALEEQSGDFDVTLVLDARADPPPDLRLPVRVVRAERPGASAARNAGWRATEAPLVLFLDDDIVAGPDLVAQHLSWHEAHPEPQTGVLGRVDWSRRVTVTPFMRWLEMGIQFDYGTIGAVEVEWQRFYSCNVSVKRSMLERSGGFDEVRFPYGYEDLELARRLSHEHGFRLLFNRAAVAEHLKSETLESWRRNLTRIAVAERRFTELYPSEPAYFHDLFLAAAQAPRARGRAARLAGFVSPGFPWLGRVVWRSFDVVCRQALAGEFLAAWEAAEPEVRAA